LRGDFRQRNAGCRGCGVGLRIRELGAGAIQRHLVVAPIELGEHVASFHRLILEHVHLDHGSADARRHLRDVPVDLRIVGRFAA
jgi:hypothetical protein